MSDLVGYRLNDKIATLSINNGKVNALSRDVFSAFNAALDQAEKDQAVVVITGHPGMFSAGYDLKEMQLSADSASALVKMGSSLSRRLLSFPTPVIVACTGHAIAKGAFLLLSADLRIGVEGPFKIGLNEVAIGMTMHHAGVELARNRLVPAYFNRSVICAEMFDPQGAMKAGFLDDLVPADALMERVYSEAAKLQGLNMKAHHQTKLKARAEYLATLDRAIALDAENLGLL